MKLEKNLHHEPFFQNTLSELLHAKAAGRGYVQPQEARSNVGYTTIKPFMSTISGDSFPFITCVNTPVRLAFEELWWMLRGGSNSKDLEEKGVNFWKGNTSRGFLDSRGLFHLPEGSMGTSYGYQWRKSGGGYDQLLKLFEGLWKDPFSRRHIVTLWNPYELQGMPLTPCWHTSQWWVSRDRDGKKELNLHLQNRSLDVLFGMNYAVSQYRLLQATIATLMGVKLGEMSFHSTIPHLYDNQVEYAKEVAERDGLLWEKEVAPTIDILLDPEESYLEALLKLLDMEWGKEVVLEGYKSNTEPFENERPQMVA